MTTDLFATGPTNDAATKSLRATMTALGTNARTIGAKALRSASPDVRTKAILAMADAIETQADAILAANAQDIAAAKENGLSEAKIDRLALTPERLAGVASGVRAVADQADPLGAEMARWDRPNGLDIARVRTPIGVIAMIYESRPNVTADAAALCVRSGNAVILRGGTEAVHSNRAIHAAVVEGLSSTGLDASCVQLVPTQDRAAVGHILSGLAGTIDLVVPRGGKSLVERVQTEARAPVLSHLDGICHVYVHAGADPQKAVDIAVNAKMRRTGICGAAETLLIDKRIAPQLLPVIAQGLTDAGCTLRADDAARAILPSAEAATEADWGTEYLAPTIAVKIVNNIDQAIAHIAEYGSEHTESIITEDQSAAEQFLGQVDSAIVMHNASTQFADGGEFGLGAEIGIATGRMHARGPVGAEQLTTFKYQVRGTGHIRP